MQLRKSAEPETLRVHREMYERRLREMEVSNGPSGKKEVDAANSPDIVEHHDSEMATFAMPPKTALEYYRELAAEADMSERGNPEECAAYELEVFEDWRSLRAKANE